MLDNAVELAWAAGLIDGEGSFFNTKVAARPAYVPIGFGLQMTEKAPVERFANLFGLNLRSGGKTSTGKEIWCVASQAEAKVKQIYYATKPFLSNHKIRQGQRVITKRDNYNDSPLKGKRLRQNKNQRVKGDK